MNKIKGLNFIKSQLSLKGDSINVIYCDHLSCDALMVVVIKNGTVALEQEVFYPNPYSGINVILPKIKEEYPDLKVYMADCAWYTYPNEWRFNLKDTASGMSYKRFTDDWVHIQEPVKE